MKNIPPMTRYHGSVFIATLLVFTLPIAASDCLFTQPHITLGNKFSFGAQKNESGKEGSLFTIALVSKGNCDYNQPRVLLRSINDKKALKVPIAYSYGVDNLKDDKGQEPYSYHREVYFWSISEEEARLYSTWTLIDQKEDPVFGPYKFPKKTLQEDSEIRMAIVGDMDNSPAS